ncbi:MAG TPA: TonB-dependent receptor [Vicinamibacterales bacterium]|nr:TonB-dependent receptor [Vicinamibacterales bacterium]
MFRVFVAAALLIAATASMFAQANTGTISGVVKDSSGGVLPGASVKISGDRAEGGLDIVTNPDGSFRTEPLQAGAYRITASLDGFETSERRIVLAADQTALADFALSPARFSQSVVVTARRVEEAAQDVPIPVSVVKGDLVSDAGAFNVDHLKEMIPTVQFYSTNPRNSAINIRGLGAPFGLTNDGLEPGVGMYIDGVFYARPASATTDFLDVDQVEVLRGPEGTLFGKNTTAGAINITTRKPSFTRSAEAEVNYGTLDFVQAKASVTGPLSKSIAGRVSFSGTTRDGTTYNTTTHQNVNDMNNLGLRGQLLYAPSSDLAVTLAIDDTRQRATCCTQLIEGIAPTLRPANRQWASIIAELHYTPPTYNPFDRVTDIDSSLRSYQDLGGASLNIDWKAGPGRLTSTTAWRYWNWNPASDRDFIGLPITTISAAPSTQRQWTQEVRYAEDVSHKLNFVAGAFLFHQDIDSSPTFQQQQGSAAARFLLAPSAAANTPGLLDGYGYNQSVTYGNTSAALFGQAQWSITDRLRVLPGLRLNYDTKNVNFDQEVYGGLQTTNPTLVALKLSILAPQTYTADVGNTNTSGQITAAYKISERINAYATYATGFKSVGLNLNGVPTDANNNPVLADAVVKPENVHNYEVGIKTTPFRAVTANLTGFDTEIRNFQTQVTNGSVGVIRGYLANAEKVRVRGAEFDSSARVGRSVSLYAAAAYTDARYVTFTDAPPPLELTGGPNFVDASDTILPGISKWAVSLGGETTKHGSVVGRSGEYFAALDTSYRSSFSSSATYSAYMIVPSYVLVNARVGFRVANGWTLSVWARNLLNTNYFDLLTAAPGNTGLIVGQPGDQRTAGVTLRFTVK